MQDLTPIPDPNSLIPLVTPIPLDPNSPAIPVTPIPAPIPANSPEVSVQDNSIHAVVGSFQQISAVRRELIGSVHERNPIGKLTDDSWQLFASRRTSFFQRRLEKCVEFIR
jgi:hypothetical protein